MTFFGTRRARQTRVFRPTQSSWERLQESLQDYRIVKPLLIGVTAVVVLLISLQSWRTRFPYREGQYVSDGALSRVDFSVENVLETQRVRRDAEDNAARVFVQHNDVIESLTATFRSQLSAVANAQDRHPEIEKGKHKECLFFHRLGICICICICTYMYIYM